jgi:hypothetical protein
MYIVFLVFCKPLITSRKSIPYLSNAEFGVKNILIVNLHFHPIFVAIENEYKKSFVLRINPETLKLLDKWAADEFRSLNGQIEFLLQKALMDAKRWKIVSSQNDRTSSDDSR